MCWMRSCSSIRSRQGVGDQSGRRRFVSERRDTPERLFEKFLWITRGGRELCEAHCQRELRRYGNEVYTAGLLHDIGLIMMDQFLKDDFFVRSGTWNGTAGYPAGGRRDFQFRHDDVGGLLLEEWNFPQYEMAVRQAESPTMDQIEQHAETAILHIAHFPVIDGTCYLEPIPHDSCYISVVFGNSASKNDMEFIMDDVEGQIQQMVEHDWF